MPDVGKRKTLKNESAVYGQLRDDSRGRIFLERVEPRTESGFPDINFVVRPNGMREGYPHMEGGIELKHFKTENPNLRSMLEPSQKAAFLDYMEAGGRQRFVLAMREDGRTFFYSTRDACRAIIGRTQEASSSWEWFPIEPKDPEPVSLLISMIMMFGGYGLE